jgi:hypothetical protein
LKFFWDSRVYIFPPSVLRLGHTGTYPAHTHVQTTTWRSNSHTLAWFLILPVHNYFWTSW